MIKFIEEGHIYVNSKGERIPSVSELIRFELGEEYANVPQTVLDNAASYGTRIHEAIQHYIELEQNANISKVERNAYISTLEDDELEAINSYEYLKKACCFDIFSVEKIVSYKGMYAGRYDGLGFMRDVDENVLFDIKTTSKLMEEHLQWQLGLYYLAMGIEPEVGYCLHLPKRDIAKLFSIRPKSNQECIDLVNRYYESKREVKKCKFIL